MRQTTGHGGATVIYPEEICFTGNNNILLINDLNNIGYFRVEFVGLGITDTRNFYGGVAEMNLSAYLSAYFNPSSTMETVIEADIKVYTGDLTGYITIHFILYKGTNRIFDVGTPITKGEINPYAQFFDFYVSAGANAEVNGNTVYFPEGYNRILQADYPGGDILIRFENTFDDTFDDTFYPGLDPINVSFVECAENGIILVWRNHWGIWQSKVFDKLNFRGVGNGNTFPYAAQVYDNLYSGLQVSKKTQSISYDIVGMGCSVEEALRLSELCTSSEVLVYDFATAKLIPCVITNDTVPISLINNSQNLTFNVLLQNDF